jgi:hypothetical protein
VSKVVVVVAWEEDVASVYGHIHWYSIKMRLRRKRRRCGGG